MTRRPGFTVLELVLVMAIIVVLATIAIPIGLSAHREANETKLRAELRQLRNAISRFVADCGGYPEELPDLMVDAPPQSCRSVENGSRMRIDPADFRGPYLITPDDAFPRDPITGERLWWYKRRTGQVRSHSPDMALDGTRYSDW